MPSPLPRRPPVPSPCILPAPAPVVHACRGFLWGPEYVSYFFHCYLETPLIYFRVHAFVQWNVRCTPTWSSNSTSIPSTLRDFQHRIQQDFAASNSPQATPANRLATRRLHTHNTASTSRFCACSNIFFSSFFPPTSCAPPPALHPRQPAPSQGPDEHPPDAIPANASPTRLPARPCQSHTHT